MIWELITRLGGTCSKSDVEFDSSAGLTRSIFVTPRVGIRDSEESAAWDDIGWSFGCEAGCEADVLVADGVGGNLNDLFNEPLAACLDPGLLRGDVMENEVKDSSMMCVAPDGC